MPATSSDDLPVHDSQSPIRVLVTSALAPGPKKRVTKSSTQKEPSRHLPQRSAKIVGLAKQAELYTKKPEYMRSSPPEAIHIPNEASETSSQYFEAPEP